MSCKPPSRSVSARLRIRPSISGIRAAVRSPVSGHLGRSPYHSVATINLTFHTVLGLLFEPILVLFERLPRSPLAPRARRELALYLAAGVVYVAIGVALPEFLFSWYVAAGYLLCVVALPALVRRLLR